MVKSLMVQGCEVLMHHSNFIPGDLLENQLPRQSPSLTLLKTIYRGYYGTLTTWKRCAKQRDVS